ncbi:MAG: DUF4315 family protein [Oscillospiraceae bacterium]
MARKPRQPDYDQEIKKIDEHIAELKARRVSLVREKIEDENRQILALVREKKLSINEVSELVNSFKHHETEVKTTNETINNNPEAKGEEKNETQKNV